MTQADTTPKLQRIMNNGGQIIAEIRAPVGELHALWAGMEEVEYFDVAPSEGEYHRCALTPRPGADPRAQIFRQVTDRGWDLRELSRSQHSLEDIFVHVTRGESGEDAP